MPFGLSNAEVTCKILIMFFRDLLDSFIIILLDNSIIFFRGHEPT